MPSTITFTTTSIRSLLLITPLLVNMTANAQPPAGISEADMQQLMQGAQAMQTCMQNVDQAALQSLRVESEQLHADIKALCAAGKRDEAQSKALAFGMKAAKDPAIQAMAECGKQMQGMLPPIPYADIERELAERHVCDME